MKTTNAPYFRESDASEAGLKKLAIIVKPTHACNLRCSYCYVPPTAEQGRMSLTTLRNLMNQAVVVGRGKRITFVWHGGEPLLLGLRFFREVASISHELRKGGHNIKNVVQTNGTLISDEFLDFIVEEQDFRLGFSLDGPAYINDVSRPHADGTGSFSEIISAISKVREREAREGSKCIGGGAICVIGKHNIDNVSEIYSFFNSQRLGLSFNPLFVSGRATADLAVDPKAYAESLCSIFDVWMVDDHAINVDPFDTLMDNLVSGHSANCVSSLSCTKSFISVGPLGDIYPCGRFDGIPEFHLGNVNDPDGLQGALMTPMHLRLDSRLETLPAICKSCTYLAICNGGCMHNAYLGGDVMGVDPFCIVYRRLFGHILSRLHTILEKAENATCMEETT